MDNLHLKCRPIACMKRYSFRDAWKRRPGGQSSSAFEDLNPETCTTLQAGVLVG